MKCLSFPLWIDLYKQCNVNDLIKWVWSEMQMKQASNIYLIYVHMRWISHFLLIPETMPRPDPDMRQGWSLTQLVAVAALALSPSYPDFRFLHKATLIFDDVCFYTKRLTPFWPFLPWKNVENAEPHPSSKIKWLGIVCKNCFFAKHQGKTFVTNLWPKWQKLTDV